MGKPNRGNGGSVKILLRAEELLALRIAAARESESMAEFAKRVVLAAIGRAPEGQGPPCAGQGPPAAGAGESSRWASTVRAEDAEGSGRMG